MSPLVQVYLMWAAIGIALAVVVYFVMNARDEFPPKARPFIAVIAAAAIIVIGPRGSHRWSTGRSHRQSSFSKSVASAKQDQARIDSFRREGAAALEKAKTANDPKVISDLVRIGNALHDAGYSADALPLYDRAHALLMAKGGGNGDWSVDGQISQYLTRYIADLKAEGRSREAGGLTVLDQKLTTLHPGRR